MPLSSLILDQTILTEMRRCIERHVRAGLLEACAVSRDLQFLDPDDVMRELWRYMDPTEPYVDELLDDATRTARKAVGEDAQMARTADMADRSGNYEFRGCL